MFSKEQQSYRWKEEFLLSLAGLLFVVFLLFLYLSSYSYSRFQTAVISSMHLLDREQGNHSGRIHLEDTANRKSST